MSDRNGNRPVLALSGGVGGAKLALGLYRILPPGTLTIVANTGDDFAHLGLAISPDLDTLLYTLSGHDNPELGWGRRAETWTFMAAPPTVGGAPRPGLLWRRSKRWAARPGFASAMAISRPISSARAVLEQARNCLRSQ